MLTEKLSAIIISSIFLEQARISFNKEQNIILISMCGALDGALISYLCFGIMEQLMISGFFYINSAAMLLGIPVAVLLDRKNINRSLPLILFIPLTYFQVISQYTASFCCGMVLFGCCDRVFISEAVSLKNIISLSSALIGFIIIIFALF